jgi:capsular exopolysaccharide synthesis family protein
MSSRDGQPPSVPAPWGGDAPWPSSGVPAIPHGDPARTPPPALSGRLDAGALLKGLRRHWVLALTLGAICASAASLLTYKLMPAPEYVARAQLLALATERGIVEEDTRASANEFRTFQKTQESLLKSPKVLNIVATTPAISKLATMREHSDDPVTWLGENLRVDFQGELMNVSLSGGRPKDIADIVNAVVNTYLDNVVNRVRFERKQESINLAKMVKDSAEKLQKKRDERAKQANEAGAPDEAMLNERQKGILEEINAAKKDQWFANSELKKAQIELEMARRKQSTTLDQARIERTIDDLVDNDPAVQALRNKVAGLEDGIAAAERNVRIGGRDPVIRESRRQLAAAQQDLQDAIAQTRAEAEAAAQNLAVAGNPNAALAEINERVEFYGSYAQFLEQKIRDLEAQSSVATKRTTDLSSIDAEIAATEAFNKKMTERYNSLEVELEAPTRVKDFAPATVPKSPDSRKRLIFTAAAGLGTFGLVLLAISFLEYRVRRIDSPDTVAHGLGMRIVGALPATPNRSRFALPGRQGAALQEAYWRSRLNESVNAIRTLMLRHAQSERMQVVMVTSASVGEGKTSLACHLATSLARAGRKTLLLDCDLRNPTAHRVFDLPLEPGMCEVLRGQVSLDEISHPIALGNLRMITAGRCDLQALHALGMDQIGDVINRLRSQFDYIVVDTPPVLPVADPLLIGQHVDAALFSILRDVSRAPKVHTAAERLASLGIRILGAVVAGTPLETSGSEYYYTAAYVNAGIQNDSTETAADIDDQELAE